jgi:hypothetical protein
MLQNRQAKSLPARRDDRRDQGLVFRPWG